MMSRIVKASPLTDYALLLFFESGHVRLLDMKPYIERGGVWAEISDPEVFSQVKVQDDLGGLEWTGEIDFCPDTAFKASKPVPSKVLRDLIVKYSPREEKKTDRRKMA
jgi:hypothetical protein